MHPRTHDDLLGEVLGGRYRVLRLLGRGGMGAVYEAEQLDLGRRVAIKVLHEMLSKDDEQLVRFSREARAAASLGHRNVVQVTDFQAEPGQLAFLVMELVPGESLAAVLSREGRQPAWRVVPIARQVLSALGAAHDAGIVHRDIKPGNVMLTAFEGLGEGAEVAKVLDFGIAKMMEGSGYTQLTMTGVALGTPAYMAPEMALGDKVDGRADLYAVGVLLFKCLAGKVPFGGSASDVLQRVVREEAPSLGPLRPDVAPMLAAVVDRALLKDPAARFQSAADMSGALAACFAEGSGHPSSDAAAPVPPPAESTTTGATVGLRPEHAIGDTPAAPHSETLPTYQERSHPPTSSTVASTPAAASAGQPLPPAHAPLGVAPAGPPRPVQRRGNRGGLILVIAAVATLALGGFGVAGYQAWRSLSTAGAELSGTPVGRMAEHLGGALGTESTSLPPPGQSILCVGNREMRFDGIDHSGGQAAAAIVTDDCHLVVTNSTLRSTSLGISVARGGRVTLTDCVVEGGGVGLTLADGSATVRGGRISGGQVAISAFQASEVSVTGTVIDRRCASDATSLIEGVSCGL